MSEEPKNIRLNKAAKEFNVGIPNLVEYLAKKGHQVDANPNARITPEQYALLATAFQSERVVKENADRAKELEKYHSADIKTLLERVKIM